MLAALISAPSLFAQDSPVQQVVAPPPLKIISREDRAQLNDAKDSKARVRLAIELAEGHLTKAEAHTAQLDFDSAAAEVGKYWALIEDTLALLSPMSRDRDKTRDLYKRLELALRAHGPRLTAMRRITPLEYALWIKDLEDFARKGRTEALNSFYGHTVVREGKQKPVEEKRSSKQSKESSPGPEKPL